MLERTGTELVRSAAQQLERQLADLERAGRNLAAYTKSAYEGPCTLLGHRFTVGAFSVAFRHQTTRCRHSRQPRRTA